MLCSVFTGGLSDSAVVGITFAITFTVAFILGVAVGAVAVYCLISRRTKSGRGTNRPPIYNEPEPVRRNEQIETQKCVAYEHTQL